jgi:serine/threonine protein kinase
MKDLPFDRKKLRFINKEIEEEFSYPGCELAGTAEYVAPETLADKNIGISVDLWALGCIIYLFLHGRTPFKDKSDLLIFDNILYKSVKYNDDIDEKAKDLIEGLLNKDLSQRLGCGAKGTDNDFEALKRHPFFEGIDWENLHNYRPPNVHITHNLKPVNLKSHTHRRSNPQAPKKQQNGSSSDKEVFPKRPIISLEDSEKKLVLECNFNLI